MVSPSVLKRDQNQTTPVTPPKNFTSLKLHLTHCRKYKIISSSIEKYA